MKDFHNFLENKKEDNNYQLKALVELASAIKGVFSKYSLNTRKIIWKKITSDKGMEEVDKIIRTPSRNVSRFRSL